MYTEKKKYKIKETLIKKIEYADSIYRKNINEHLTFKPLSIYMIIGAYHRLGIQNNEKCLVVSSVNIEDKYKGKGYFKSYMNILTEIAKELRYRIVFESVLNEDLKLWLIKHSYKEIPGLNNFYKDF